MSAGPDRNPKRPDVDQKDHALDLSAERLLAEHTRSRTRSRPRWSPKLGGSATGHVPSSRFQTPADGPCGPHANCSRHRTSDTSTRPIGLWWSQTGSNRRPHACKARALPAELWPRNQKTNARSIKVVGLGRLELPTSRLSSARSNQLSYKPLTLPPMRIRDMRARNRLAPMHRTALKPLARVRPRRKRNEDGEIPPMQLNDLAICWPLMFLRGSIAPRSGDQDELKNHP